MLEKILNEMLKNGTIIDAYSQNNNGKIYSYYGIEYNDEIFDVMCIDDECKSIEKVWKGWKKWKIKFVIM